MSKIMNTLGRWGLALALLLVGAAPDAEAGDGSGDVQLFCD